MGLLYKKIIIYTSAVNTDFRFERANLLPRKLSLLVRNLMRQLQVVFYLEEDGVRASLFNFQEFKALSVPVSVTLYFECGIDSLPCISFKKVLNDLCFS